MPIAKYKLIVIVYQHLWPSCTLPSGTFTFVLVFTYLFLEALSIFVITSCTIMLCRFCRLLYYQRSPPRSPWFLRLLYRPAISSSSYYIVDQKTFCCFVHIKPLWIQTFIWVGLWFLSRIFVIIKYAWIVCRLTLIYFTVQIHSISYQILFYLTEIMHMDITEHNKIKDIEHKHAQSALQKRDFCLA